MTFHLSLRVKVHNFTELTRRFKNEMHKIINWVLFRTETQVAISVNLLNS